MFNVEYKPTMANTSLYFKAQSMNTLTFDEFKEMVSKHFSSEPWEFSQKPVSHPAYNVYSESANGFTAPNCYLAKADTVYRIVFDPSQELPIKVSISVCGITCLELRFENFVDIKLMLHTCGRKTLQLSGFS